MDPKLLSDLIWIGLVLLALAFVGLLVIAQIAVFMWAWNLVCAGLFHWPRLGFMQAVALTLVGNTIAAWFRFFRSGK